MNMTPPTSLSSIPNPEAPAMLLRTDPEIEAVEAAEAGLVTEDDAPVDNYYSELQMAMLTETLRSSWKTERKRIVASDVGVFYALSVPPIVPDVFVSMDVERFADTTTPPGKSYLVWRMGKGPEIAIEIVSNNEGGELTTKKRIYAELLKVNYYVVWDPEGYLSNEPLTVFAMNEGYRSSSVRFFPEIGLGLAIWKGEYDGESFPWVRWTDEDGALLPFGKEQGRRADEEAKRAEAEGQRAEAEGQRAAAERQRAEHAERELAALKAKLREQGFDPDQLAK
jgi:Uma2 family endonuclease